MQKAKRVTIIIIVVVNKSYGIAHEREKNIKKRI